MKSVVGIILAAGASIRMGRPKQLLSYQGGTLLQHAISVLLSSQCSEVRVVLGANEKLIRPGIEGLPVEILSNPNWKTGMASSLQVGLKNLPMDADAVLMALADQPLIPHHWYDRLIEAFAKGPQTLVATSYQGKAGVPAIWGQDWFAPLNQLSGQQGARKLIRENLDQCLCLEFSAAAQDIDTPEDYDRLIS